MRVPIVQVDAFTERPFGGNPAAVCLLPGPRDERWMQALAKEMNLPATAFVLADADGHRLRWFTAAVELELCGHGTLAAAHVLWEGGHLAPSAAARFHTRSGALHAEREGALISLDFPATPTTPAAPSPLLARALGVTPKSVARARLDHVVEVDSEETLRGLAPDFALLATIETRGIVVTCRSSSPEFDFVSRFFAPRIGIDEDQATGSAHCALGPFWSERLERSDLVAYQASARGGVIRVRVDGDRVRLGGHAITVLRAEASA